MRVLNFTHPLRALAQQSALLVTLVAALTITACGGGGNTSSDGAGASVPNTSGNPVTTPVTNADVAIDSFSSGAISGFGSIIVNGVRFDDSRSSVNDDDDDNSPSRSSSDLRLGMVVSVTGTSGTGTNTATGTATAINFSSELQGPVQSIGSSPSNSTGTSTTSAATQTLVILGQTVLTNARTLYDASDLPSGFASIRIGQVLEVHGFHDPALNRIVATRIESKTSPNAYKITGNVASLNTVSKTFKIGSETINYATVAANRLNVNLVNGITVRVNLSTSQTTTGTWNASRVKSNSRSSDGSGNSSGNAGRVEIESVITSFTSATNFSVRGFTVNASNASFPKGTVGLSLGAQVEIKGSIVNGILVATRVQPESSNDNSSSNSNGSNGGNSGSGNSGSGNSSSDSTSSSHEIELHGAISNVNAIAKTFTLRGVNVSYAGTVVFERGTALNLINGAKVEVKGFAASGGTIVQTQKIKFED
jgi:Domain of unknown function (DUF5666)